VPIYKRLEIIDQATLRIFIDLDYPEYEPFTRAFHYAARAIARAGKGDIARARKEQAVYLV
jgi:hypothetical protein